MSVPSLAGLGPEQQALAGRRWEVLRPHVQGGVPLTQAAREAQVPLRSAQRWLVRYRVVTKLDRLGRSLEHLIDLSQDLHTRGVDLVVLDQGIDTSTAVGRAMIKTCGSAGEDVPSR